EQAADDAERAFDHVDAAQVHLRKRLTNRFESALQRLEALKTSQRARPLHAPLVLDEQELQELRSLLQDLPGLWCDPNVTSEQRKAVIRLVIEAVHVTPGPETWTFQIEWAGGARTSFTLLTRRGVQAMVERLHVERRTVPEILEHLTQQGIMQFSGRAAGKPYTEQRVLAFIRRRRFAQKD